MSSKRGVRRKSCTGKARHACYLNATYAITGMEAAGINTENLKPYRCQFCDGYHVGHSEHLPETFKIGWLLR